MLHFSENIRLDADAKIALRAVKDPPLGVHSLMVHRLTAGHQPNEEEHFVALMMSCLSLPGWKLC